jgi:hypothetical protein
MLKPDERVARGVCVVAMLAACAGCAETHGGRVLTSAEWGQRAGSLGKVAIWTAGTEDGSMATTHAEQVHRVLAAALAKLPATQVIDTDAKRPPAFAKDIGDAEALTWARGTSADTVCIMNVADYGGVFWIGAGLPYLLGWDYEMRAMYSLRILDVKSGTLLLHCISSRKTGGLHAVWVDSDVEGNLKKSLERDLRPPAR